MIGIRHFEYLCTSAPLPAVDPNTRALVFAGLPDNESTRRLGHILDAARRSCSTPTGATTVAPNLSHYDVLLPPRTQPEPPRIAACDTTTRTLNDVTLVQRFSSCVVHTFLSMVGYTNHTLPDGTPLTPGWLTYAAKMMPNSSHYHHIAYVTAAPGTFVQSIIGHQIVYTPPDGSRKELFTLPPELAYRLSSPLENILARLKHVVVYQRTGNIVTVRKSPSSKSCLLGGTYKPGPSVTPITQCSRVPYE